MQGITPWYNLGMITRHILPIIALLIITNCGGDMDANFDRNYERESPEFIKQGNEFLLRKGPLFDYGPEVKLLHIQVEKPQWITVTFQVRPAQVVGLYRNAGPIVGRAQIGADAGAASYEFNLDVGKDQTFHPANPGPGNQVTDNLGGSDQRRFGVTSVSFFTKALDIYARLDVNLRTLLPASQPPDGDTAGIDPFPGTDFTVPISAWASYGTKGFGTAYRSWVISRGVLSVWTPGTFVSPPIPAGAKRFRVFRQDDSAAGIAPSIRASIGNNGVTTVHQIPANSNEWVEIPRGCDFVSLRNDGGDNISNAICEYQLEF